MNLPFLGKLLIFPKRFRYAIATHLIVDLFSYKGEHL
jgi:hypothetical protein